MKTKTNPKLKNTKTKAISYEQMPNTPFNYVTDGEKHYIMIGNTPLHNEPYKTKEEAIKAFENPNWQTICNVTLTLIQKVKEYEKNK